MKTKLTKILATVPNTCDAGFIRLLFEAGMNGVRLNTAHQSPAESLEVVRMVRSVSPNIAILLDTKGPEVRTREIDAPLSLARGEEVLIRPTGLHPAGLHPAGSHPAGSIPVRILPDGSPPAGPKWFSTSYPDFTAQIGPGSTILIDDGLIELTVEAREEGVLHCRAVNGGEIKKNKSVNTPGCRLKLPSLQDKDRDFIQFAIDEDIDFIAHSFVRGKDDLLAIQDLLDARSSAVKLIAKIENQEGVDHLEEILASASGVMVARGDLGVEVPLEKLPGIQKRIIRECLRRSKIVITATQMLQSMIDNPRPTRAEVSDVANAVFDGTDVLMLSGETAYGKYPVEAVKVMAKIAAEAESARPDYPFQCDASSNRIRDYLVSAAARSVRELPVKGIIADSLTGRVARMLSSYRPRVPIFVKSPNSRTVRELALSYGVQSDLQPLQESTDKLIKASINSLLSEGFLQVEDLVALVGSPPGSSGSTNFLQITSAFLALSGE